MTVPYSLHNLNLRTHALSVVHTAVLFHYFACKALIGTLVFDFEHLS